MGPSMSVCKSEAMPKWRVLERLSMCMVWWTLVLKEESGLMKRRLPVDRSVGFVWIELWPRRTDRSAIVWPQFGTSPVAASDHGLILLSWRPDESSSNKKNFFKYEVVWETHDEFLSMLMET